MVRLLAGLAISLALSSTTVLAEELHRTPGGAGNLVNVRAEGHLGSPEQQRACRIDVLRHCREEKDDNAMARCLRANESELTHACRRALEHR